MVIEIVTFINCVYWWARHKPKLCIRFEFQGFMVKIPDSDQDSKLIVLDSSLCLAPQFSAS